jgi:hypothetical protein
MGKMMKNLILTTSISDSLLQQLRSFLDAQADCVAGGNDPAQEAEPNAAMILARLLDFETDGEFQ